MNEAMIESIKRTMSYNFAEICSEELLRQLRGDLSAYLKTFEPEYLVVCDETNNTPKTIDSNELHVSVYEKNGEKFGLYEHEFTMNENGISYTEVRID